MHQKRVITDAVCIHALPSKIWNVLIQPEYTRQYLFDLEVLSDWQKDSPINFEVEFNGQRKLVKRGKVLDIIPGLFLKFALSELEKDITEQVETSYDLLPERDGIILKGSHEVFLAVEEEYIHHARNWTVILRKIKWLSEYG